MPALLPGPEIIFLPEWTNPEDPCFWEHHPCLFPSLCHPIDGDLAPMSQSLLLHTWCQGCKPTGGAQVPQFTEWKKKGSSWKCGEGPFYLHILWVVGLGGPVWNPPHATLPIAKLLTERPILWLGVPAAVGVMEGDIQEERPAGGGMGLSAEVKVRWLTHHPTSTLGSLILQEGTPPPALPTPLQLMTSL